MVPPTATAAATATARLLRDRCGPEGLWLAVDGGSMRPTIEPPGKVLVVARPAPRYGEVWAFADPAGGVVVHRLTARRGDGLVFHGDALARPDPAVPTLVLVGRAVRVRDPRGERDLATADRLRGLARHAARHAGAGVRRVARWAFLLITRAPRRRYRRSTSTPGGTDT